MAKLYIEISILRPKSQDEWAINKEAKIISDLYCKLLPQFKIKDLGKIGIYFDPQDHGYIQKPTPLIKICVIQKNHDFSLFFTKTIKQRAKELLDLLQSNIEEACQKFGWDVTPFQETYKRVIEKDFRNKYILWGKKTFSKDRKHKAGVQLDVQVTGALISILFFDKEDRLIKEVEVFNVRPDYYFIQQLIDKAKWVNNFEFVLSNKNNEIQFEASLEKDKPDLILSPVHKTEQMLINDLQMLHADTNKEDVLKLIKENIQIIKGEK